MLRGGVRWVLSVVCHRGRVYGGLFRSIPMSHGVGHGGWTAFTSSPSAAAAVRRVYPHRRHGFFGVWGQSGNGWVIPRMSGMGWAVVTPLWRISRGSKVVQMVYDRVWWVTFTRFFSERSFESTTRSQVREVKREDRRGRRGKGW